MPSRDFVFDGHGGRLIMGTLDAPATTPRGWAIFAHCFTCTRQSKAAVAVSRELSQRGIACLRFDFTGLGDSEGDFGADSFPGDVADVTAAAGWLVNRFGSGVLLVNVADLERRVGDLVRLAETPPPRREYAARAGSRAR